MYCLHITPYAAYHLLHIFVLYIQYAATQRAFAVWKMSLGHLIPVGLQQQIDIVNNETIDTPGRKGWKMVVSGI